MPQVIFQYSDIKNKFFVKHKATKKTLYQAETLCGFVL